MTDNTDLNGLWSGSYGYALMGDGVPITVWFDETGGRLAGTIIEPNTFVLDGPNELSSTIDGFRDGLSLQFAKTYDPASGAHQTPIAYEARVDEAFTEIKGIWQFRQADTFSGNFTLSRTSKGLATGIMRRQSVPVDQ